MQILCCGGTGCKASESAKIVENIRSSLQEHGIADKVDVIVPGCFGFCEKGPIVKIVPDNTFYTSVRPADVEEIVTSHIIGGKENLEVRKPQGLTPRELEVLQLTSSGYSNSQIASALEISLNTVDSYKERIKGKFGLDSIVECVATAAAKGIVTV